MISQMVFCCRKALTFIKYENFMVQKCLCKLSDYIFETLNQNDFKRSNSIVPIWFYIYNYFDMKYFYD